jgi:lysozyme
MTLYEFIEKHEGRRKKPYRCPAGKLTIGVGHNIDANPLPIDIKRHLEEYGSIDNEMIDRLLNQDIRIAVDGCKTIFPMFAEFSDNRRMALIDFVFQLGFTGARRFVRSVKAINAEKWEDAARYMGESLWARQTPKRAKEVIELIREG